MEHVIASDQPGVVREIALEIGDTIFEGTPIVFVEPQDVEGEYSTGETIDLDAIRADIAEVDHYRSLAMDEARVAATAKRHDKGKRTARENIEDLCDDGSFLRVRPAGDGDALPRRHAGAARGAHRQDRGRCDGHGRRAGERRPRGPGERALHRHVVRLHGARGNAGPQEPPEAGPHVRRRQEAPAAGRAVHRGRRRPDPERSPQRRQPLHGVRRRTPDAHLARTRQAVRPRADRRRQLRLLLRRQRRAARRLRRDHRHRGLEPRGRRPRRDRGRRSRRLRARRGGPGQHPGAERRHRHRRQGRGRGDRRRQALPVVLPGPRQRVGGARPAHPAPHRPREPAGGLRLEEGDRDPGRRRLDAGTASEVRTRHGDGVHPHRGTAGGRDREQLQLADRAAPSTPTPRTRRRASCSSATRSTSRSCP